MPPVRNGNRSLSAGNTRQGSLGFAIDASGIHPAVALCGAIQVDSGQTLALLVRKPPCSPSRPNRQADSAYAPAVRRGVCDDPWLLCRSETTITCAREKCERRIQPQGSKSRRSITRELNCIRRKESPNTQIAATALQGDDHRAGCGETAI
jgi:hypothetical protein